MIQTLYEEMQTSIAKVQVENARLRSELAALGWRRWDEEEVPRDGTEFEMKSDEDGDVIIATWSEGNEGPEPKMPSQLYSLNHGQPAFFRPIPPVPEVGE